MEVTKLAELRARRALAGAGLSPDAPLVPVESATNEVWAAGDVVIRVGSRMGSRLRREALLAPHLPTALRYPAVIAAGAESGTDWLVMERIRGVPLVRCWPGMTVDERRDAVEQFAVAVRALHETPAPPDLPEASGVPPLLQWATTATAAIEPLIAALERVADLEHVDRRLMEETIVAVRGLAPVLDDVASPTLIHGDLHFQNVLWDGSEVTAVLDLEFARAAPPDLDLDVFLRFCAFPFLFVPVGREAEAASLLYAEVPYWFRGAYPELFEHPRVLDRLRLYAVAFDVKELLANPPRRSLSGLTAHHPYRRLLSTARGESYLDALARNRG